MKWRGEEGAALLDGNENVGRRQHSYTATSATQVGWSQIMGSQKCQDRADAFHVAGMYSVGKKVVGLAVLERGWCPLCCVGHESEQQAARK